jgi:hypothetical protein
LSYVKSHRSSSSSFSMLLLLNHQVQLKLRSEKSSHEISGYSPLIPSVLKVN